MSQFTEAVVRGLKGCEAASTGLCPGCDECRSAFDEFTVREIDDSELPAWTFKAAQSSTPGDDRGRAYFDEAEAEAASREAFREAWSSGKVFSEASFRRGGCGICGSPQGGDFEDWHCIIGGEIRHFTDACVDCVLFLANGDEPQVGYWAEREAEARLDSELIGTEPE